MKQIHLLLIFAMLSAIAVFVHADEFSSTNYSVTAPVTFPGGYGTSSSFGLSSVISSIANGSSTAASFKLFAGFLYFPYVSTPVVSATAGNAQVALSWTSADGSLGWAVSGYALGQSTLSGGPYTYTDVGNVLASTPTGLSNGVPYYFVIRVKDALGNFVATSTQATAIPVAPVVTPPSGGGGGGGGGGETTTSTGSANFSGRAYPRSTITILKDAQVVTSTVADAAAQFSVTLSSLTPGNYFFSVYSEDAQGRRSSLLTFPVSITAGSATNITGIYITPTIAVDKSEVKKGDDIAIFGQTTAKSEVTIQVNSDEPFFAKTTTDNAGIYLYNFDTTPLELGDHSTKSKVALKNEISAYSSAVAFKVGTKNVAAVAAASAKCVKRGDQNGDCRVNLVDYSIIAYWYKRASPPKSVDLNGDGKVTLSDFSILAYNWTG
ncbi:MAG: hypothetical protein RLZZ67_575 [Candidatus Parcubacteria bacterium]|jgi:hypothetical protein